MKVLVDPTLLCTPLTSIRWLQLGSHSERRVADNVDAEETLGIEISLGTSAVLESTKSANVGNAANRVGVMDRAQAMKLSMGLVQLWECKRDDHWTWT